MDSHRRNRPSLVRDDHVEATAFLHEILMTADALRDARAFDGEPAMHLEARSRLLRAIERCGGAPTFTDLGRLLGMSRQIALTSSGRRDLERQRKPQVAWIFTLLNGLDPARMRSTRHVLRVIRLRLERYERELRAAARSLSAASARR